MDTWSRKNSARKTRNIISTCPVKKCTDKTKMSRSKLLEKPMNGVYKQRRIWENAKENLINHYEQLW